MKKVQWKLSSINQKTAPSLAFSEEIMVYIHSAIGVVEMLYKN